MRTGKDSEVQGRLERRACTVWAGQSLHLRVGSSGVRASSAFLQHSTLCRHHDRESLRLFLRAALRADERMCDRTDAVYACV